VFDPVACKLDGGVQDLVLVDQTGKGDNDVFACDAGRQAAVQRDRDDAGNLPPELASRPNAA
jgi:hypothetical protein